MNYYAWKVNPSDGKLSPLQYEREIDRRADSEKLNEAIDRHLANAALIDAMCSGPVQPSEEAMGAAEKAKEDSEAVLVRLVEDITLVSYDKLLRAMSA